MFVKSLGSLTNSGITGDGVFYIYVYFENFGEFDSVPFYVGKGLGKRSKSHTYNLDNFEKDGNKRFRNKLRSMRREGVEPIIVMLAENIEDETIAYEIEIDFIEHYGRKGIDPGGVLLNLLPGGTAPPNHKGKTYTQIYGNLRGEEVRKRKHDQQIAAGGWFKGRTHSIETKAIQAQKSKEAYRNRSTSIQEYSDHLRKFHVYFNGKISQKKLKWWLKRNNLLRLNRMFSEYGSILKYCHTTFGSEIVYEKSYWFHDPVTFEQCRISDWEYEMNIKLPPANFIRGRGKVIVDASSDSFKGFEL
jgi:hypothetical protein